MFGMFDVGTCVQATLAHGLAAQSLFPPATLGLMGFAFLAGLIDAIVGGGGLIQLPALLILLPHTAIATLFGTNKLSSIAGTTMAVVQYRHRVAIPWATVLPGALAAGLASYGGALAVKAIQPQLLRPLILGLLVLVGGYTAIKQDFGQLHQPKLSSRCQQIGGTAIAAVIGFYDGFFGPGTGSFLIFAQISLLGFDFLTASASAKVINWATNFAALLAFAWTGQVLYAVAIPMALCNVLGATLGSRWAIAKGSGVIRPLFLVVVTTLVAKLAYDLAVG